MPFRSIVMTSAFVVLSLVPGAALAESRLALVIGNSAYRSATPLPNPVRDAKAVADLLQSAGFEVVPAADLTQSQMLSTIRDFALRVASRGQDTIAVVYYAGHGLQVGGENFLVPVDATIKNQTEVALQAVRFDDLMNMLEGVPTKARIVILDACRNNPFEDMKKTVGRGLAMVNAPVGSVVAYSTSPGTEAEDGEGANSPFTSAFIDAARQPGMPVEQIFKNVRLAVHNATSGRQTPWEVVSLTTNFSFFPARTESAPATAATPAATPVSLPTDKDPARTSDNPATRSAYWNRVLRSLGPQKAYERVVLEDRVDAYREYLVLYGNTPNAARLRIIVDRRQEMVAWYTAVTVNSPASYRFFLTRYGASDMAITARGLLNRATTRSLLASTDPAALGIPGCDCTVAPSRRADPKAAPRSGRPARNAARPSGPEIEVVEPVPVGPRPIGIGRGGAGVGGGVVIGPGRGPGPEPGGGVTGPGRGPGPGPGGGVTGPGRGPVTAPGGGGRPGGQTGGRTPTQPR